MRKEGKSTRYALVCFYISLFAYSRARFKSFTRTFGKNFVFVLERGREKQISNNRTVFLSRVEKIWSFRLFAKAKNENESQESEDDSFHRSKTFRAFAFGGCSDSNVPPNERAQSFSRSVGFLSLSLSVKSVKTRTAFLPDLGSILNYFEGKKGGVLERKNNNKNPSSL